MDRLKQLESFVAVSLKGSLTAAANAEGVAPAVIGRRIDALEERLGVKLLVRTTRRITLTHEGSSFLEDCQRLLIDIANAEGSVSAGGVKASGHLRITAPAGFGRRHVAPLVPRFVQQHADVSLSLNLSDRVVDIVNESVDCAVRVGDLPDSSLVSVRLADNRRLCVAAPAYLKRAGTPAHPSELARHECLVLSSDASQSRGWAFSVDGALTHLRPSGQAGLQRRPGAARLVPAGPGHRLAQHLGGGARGGRWPAGGAAGGLRRAAERHLRGVSATQAPAAARAPCGSISSNTATAMPPTGRERKRRSGAWR